MRLWGMGLLLTGALVAAPMASAQTNDRYFRSWAWRADIGAARAAGLGGAYVALADDAYAPLANPAGLALAQRLSVSLATLSRSSAATKPMGDTWSSRSGLGYVGGGALLTRRLALGAYLSEPHAAEIALNEEATMDASRPRGDLRAVVTEGGVAGAWKLTERVFVGARAGISHLQLEGQWSSWSAQGVETLRVGTAATSGGANRPVVGAGVLALVTDTVRFGATGELGASYECERTAVDPTISQTLENAGTYNLRQPSKATGGLSWQASPKVRLSAQADYVRYSEMKPAVRYGAGAAADYTPKDGVEPRGGVEVSWPAGRMSVQLRGGVHVRAMGALALSYSGADAGEASIWTSDVSRAEFAAGGSLVARGWRIDVGGTFGGLRRTVVAGFTVRP